MKFPTFSASMLLAAASLAPAVSGLKESYMGSMTVYNMAPMNGTCITPVWMGIHDGSFDVFSPDEAASPALEPLVEDGDGGLLSAAFAAANGTVWEAFVGGAPLCPGENATVNYVMTIDSGIEHFISYATMILPSNDAFVGNGDPTFQRIFADEETITMSVAGASVWDAGTEVNDEDPVNTAFLTQKAPNTGETENGVVTLHEGFKAAGEGGIVDVPDFSAGDFKADGYEVMKIEITTKKIVTKSGTITVKNEAPATGTCQTPVWVATHDGSFKTFATGMAAPEYLEPLVEDGEVGELMSAFAGSTGSVWDAVVAVPDRPTKPILCPGDEATLSFDMPVVPGVSHYFSYASMVLPSNDAFVGNDDPMAFQIFNEDGEFVPVSITVMGSSVYDAGTEVNDEQAESTPLLGQAAPNTGTTEDGIITAHPGLLSASDAASGVLSSDAYAGADFTEDGYTMMSITVALNDDAGSNDDEMGDDEMGDDEMGEDSSSCMPHGAITASAAALIGALVM